MRDTSRCSGQEKVAIRKREMKKEKVKSEYKGVRGK